MTDLLYLILAGQSLQILHRTFKPEGKYFGREKTLDFMIVVRFKVNYLFFFRPGHCEEGCQVCRVGGDDDEPKQPPLETLQHLKANLEKKQPQKTFL